MVARAEQTIAETNTLFVLENLDNLRKNGRLTKVQAMLTGALRIKLMKAVAGQKGFDLPDIA